MCSEWLPAKLTPGSDNVGLLLQGSLITVSNLQRLGRIKKRSNLSLRQVLRRRKPPVSRLPALNDVRQSFALAQSKADKSRQLLTGAGRRYAKTSLSVQEGWCGCGCQYLKPFLGKNKPWRKSPLIANSNFLPKT